MQKNPDTIYTINNATSESPRYPIAVHLYHKDGVRDGTGMVWEYPKRQGWFNYPLLELIDDDPWQDEHVGVAKMNLWDTSDAGVARLWERTNQFMAVLGYFSLGIRLSWEEWVKR